MARREVLYYLQDTHWNDFGRRVAYHEILRNCRRLFPKVQIRPDLEFKAVAITSDWRPDLRDAIGLHPETQIDRALTPLGVPVLRTTTSQLNRTPKADPRLTVYENPHGHLRVLIYGDSFFCGGPLVSWLAHHFEKTISLWKEDGMRDRDFNEVIEREKPDLIIEGRAERWLYEGLIR